MKSARKCFEKCPQGGNIILSIFRRKSILCRAARRKRKPGGSWRERQKQSKAGQADRLRRGLTALSSLQPGQGGRIVSLQLSASADRDRLRSFGLIPGTCLVVERVTPVLAVRLEFSHLFMDRELAAKIILLPFS